MDKETKRLRPPQIAEDEDGFAALQAISNYAPVNEAYALTAIAAAHDDLQKAWTAEAQAQATLDACRDNSVEAEWTFHKLMLGGCRFFCVSDCRD